MTRLYGRNLWVVELDLNKDVEDRVEPQRFHTYESAVELAQHYVDSKIEGPFSPQYLDFRREYETLTEDEHDRIDWDYPGFYILLNSYYRLRDTGGELEVAFTDSRYVDLAARVYQLMNIHESFMVDRAHASRY